MAEQSAAKMKGKDFHTRGRVTLSRGMSRNSRLRASFSVGVHSRARSAGMVNIQTDHILQVVATCVGRWRCGAASTSCMGFSIFLAVYFKAVEILGLLTIPQGVMAWLLRADLQSNFTRTKSHL